MTKFVVEFGREAPPAGDDGRLDTPAYHRNIGPISEVVTRALGGARGHAIEIGSGTGQHIVTLARALPYLTWWPSDPSPAHRRSIEAWRRASGLANVMPPVALDAAREDWALGSPGMPPNNDIAALLSINVVHIAPWAVAEGIFRMAGRVLRRGGYLILYGPYAMNGVHTAPSNAAFDASLRSQDSRWGVRDVADMKSLAKRNRLALDEIIAMPADNMMLIMSALPDGVGL